MNSDVLRNRLRSLLSHPEFRRHRVTVVSRVLRWALHCLVRVPARVHLRDAGVRLYLPPVWRSGGSTSVFLFRERYEPEFPTLRALDSGMVFVDGGANTGAFAMAAARRVGDHGRVLAVEPGERCFRALERSVALNGFGQVSLHPQALSDHRSVARLYHHDGRDNQFSLGGQNGDIESSEIETITVADLLAESGFDRLDYLKLDIEGAQELALRGCHEILERNKPVVLIENNVEACRRLGLRPSGAFELLGELGYAFYQVDSEGVAHPLADVDGVRTVLAVHPERSAWLGAPAA